MAHVLEFLRVFIQVRMFFGFAFLVDNQQFRKTVVSLESLIKNKLCCVSKFLQTFFCYLDATVTDV